MAQTRKVSNQKQQENPIERYKVIPYEQAESLAELFVLLASPTRIRIVYLLLQYPGILHVEMLGQILGLAQPTISHHLRIMRTGGLVKVENKGLYRFYALEDNLPTHIRGQLHAILHHEQD